jgi:pyridoxamine 5'-phosphate oxidase
MCPKNLRPSVPRTLVTLLESKAPPDPLTLFRRWYRESEAAGAPQPDAMALATAGIDGPSVRMVLFKGIDDGSFLFYSNYESRKGRDLAQDSRAAVVFYWFQTHHQVRVSGRVRRLSRKASLEYFRSRPRGAQLSALASRQSSVIPSREVLERAVAELAAKHPSEVPLPADWGGYALRPRWIEFWESREDRLHDRLRYARRADGRWRIERLAP